MIDAIFTYTMDDIDLIGDLSGIPFIIDPVQPIVPLDCFDIIFNCQLSMVTGLPYLPIEMLLMIRNFLDRHDSWRFGAKHYTCCFTRLASPITQPTHVDYILGPFDAPECAPEHLSYLNLLYSILRLASEHGVPLDGVLIRGAINIVIHRASRLSGQSMGDAVRTQVQHAASYFVDMIRKNRGLPSAQLVGVPAPRREVAAYNEIDRLFMSVRDECDAARRDGLSRIIEPLAEPDATYAYRAVLHHAEMGTIHTITIGLLWPSDDYSELSVFIAMLMARRYTKAQELVPRLGLVELFEAAQASCGADDDVDQKRCNDTSTPYDFAGVVTPRTYEADRFIRGIDWASILVHCDMETFRVILNELAKSRFRLAGMRLFVFDLFDDCLNDHKSVYVAIVLLEYFDSVYGVGGIVLHRTLEQCYGDPSNIVSVNVEMWAAIHDWALRNGYDGIGDLVGKEYWSMVCGPMRDDAVRQVSDPFWFLTATVHQLSAVDRYLAMFGVDIRKLDPNAN